MSDVKRYHVNVRFLGEGYANRTISVLATSPHEARAFAREEYVANIRVGPAVEVSQNQHSATETYRKGEVPDDIIDPPAQPMEDPGSLLR